MTAGAAATPQDELAEVMRKLAELSDETLCERLRGLYRIPVNDGAGPLDGSKEFVRQFETAPIQHEAARRIEAQRIRPMNDAPMDGTLILLAVVLNENPMIDDRLVGYWEEDEWGWTDHHAVAPIKDRLIGWWPLPSIEISPISTPTVQP